MTTPTINLTITHTNNLYELELNDGYLHARTTLNTQHALAFYDMLEQLINRQIQDLRVETGHTTIDMWDDGYKQIGMRIVATGLRITGRINVEQVVRFRNVLAELVG